MRSQPPEHEEHIMRIPLTQADVGKPLTIHKMANPELGTRLGRMGLFDEYPYDAKRFAGIHLPG